LPHKIKTFYSARLLLTGYNRKTKSNMKNAINWFQIPVTDMNRAIKFYNTILSADISAVDVMGTKVALLPYEKENGGVGGALYAGQEFTPSYKGTLVLLNAGDNLSKVLSKVEVAGGKIVFPKTKLQNSTGYIARIIDTEGNQVGLHSFNP